MPCCEVRSCAYRLDGRHATGRPTPVNRPVWPRAGCSLRTTRGNRFICTDHALPVGSPTSPPPPHRSGSPRGDDAGISETWLVRILLVVAFGLAFGIEGMTLVRSFFLDDPSETATEQTAGETLPRLEEGDALVPALEPPVRVRGLRLRAAETAWTFELAARPDSPPAQPYTLTFDRLSTSPGPTLTTAPSHTWSPADTASFTASWSLSPGRRPEALTITATRQISADSTVSSTRTVDVGHVPVRMQRD